MSTGAEHEVDVLVIGAGVAGLSVALGLAATRRVLLVDASATGAGGSTGWAQGGIAAAVAESDDPLDHARDTATAGVELCEEQALGVLVEEGPQRVADLVAVGARFDRTSDGRLATTLEGGHGRRRVVHAGGDATGAEVARVLAASAFTTRLPWWRSASVSALLVGRGAGGSQVAGALVETPEGEVQVRARAVVLATGGIGHVYRASTNPAGVDGTGLALALRAGATLTDLEFVQFHPTALHTGASCGQLPLVTEALRGERALLRDDEGRAFMAGRHPLGDLAPRDVVAREIYAVMTAGGRPHVWLDATALGATLLSERFPTVLASCARIGVDPAVTPIPVAPAEHFLCGGVRTDRWGATDVPGLYAVGEVAATGVHGANRLASNSLLEGLVFGRRVAARLTLELPETAGELRPCGLEADPAAAAAARELISTHAGVVRDGEGLDAAAEALDRLAACDPTWLVARSVIAAAALRRESRGAHFRRDFPSTREWWRRRTDVRLNPDGRPVAGVAPEPVATGRAA